MFIELLASLKLKELVLVSLLYVICFSSCHRMASKELICRIDWMGRPPTIPPSHHTFVANAQILFRLYIYVVLIKRHQLYGPSNDYLLLTLSFRSYYGNSFRSIWSHIDTQTYWTDCANKICYIHSAVKVEFFIIFEKWRKYYDTTKW